MVVIEIANSPMAARQSNSPLLSRRTCRPPTFLSPKQFAIRWGHGSFVPEGSHYWFSRKSHIAFGAPSSQENVISTTGKLTISAFIGGALIKYGSLYIDLPFHPSALAALAIVSTPPIGFAIWMTMQDDAKE